MLELEEKCFPKKKGRKIFKTWQISQQQKKHTATLLSPHQPFQPTLEVWIPRNSPQERYSPGSEPSFARFATKSDTWYQISTMRLCSLGFFNTEKVSKKLKKKGKKEEIKGSIISQLIRKYVISIILTDLSLIHP